MARAVKGQGLEGRILLLLVERYPVTVRQVALALGAREDSVRREVKRLTVQGLVVVEPLGDDEYVALSGAGVRLLGLPAKEAARLRARRPAPAAPPDADDPAFG